MLAIQKPVGCKMNNPIIAYLRTSRHCPIGLKIEELHPHIPGREGYNSISLLPAMRQARKVHFTEISGRSFKVCIRTSNRTWFSSNPISLSTGVCLVLFYSEIVGCKHGISQYRQHFRSGLTSSEFAPQHAE